MLEYLQIEDSCFSLEHNTVLKAYVCSVCGYYEEGYLKYNTVVLGMVKAKLSQNVCFSDLMNKLRSQINKDNWILNDSECLWKKSQRNHDTFGKVERKTRKMRGGKRSFFKRNINAINERVTKTGTIKQVCNIKGNMMRREKFVHFHGVSIAPFNSTMPRRVHFCSYLLAI